RMHAETTIFTASLYMAVLGCGMGLVMQVLVIAVQNTVPYADLGVATSGATLFRLIGGPLGTAVFGAIFATELATHLQSMGSALPAGTAISPQAIGELAPADRAIYISSFTASLSTRVRVRNGRCPGRLPAHLVRAGEAAARDGRCTGRRHRTAGRRALPHARGCALRA